MPLFTNHSLVAGPGFDDVHPLSTAHPLSGREDVLQSVELIWKERGRGLALLHGPSGAGKSAILAEQLERDAPDNGFAWSFSLDPDADAMLRRLYRHIASPGATGGPTTPSWSGTGVPVTFTPSPGEGLRSASREPSGLGLTWRIIECIEDIGPFTLVFDGLEKVQRGDGEMSHYGLQRLLEWVAQAGGEVFCIGTTELPVALEGRACAHLRVPPLSLADSVQMLWNGGVRGSDDEVKSVAEACGGQPLPLLLAARGIVRYLASQARSFLEIPSPIDLTARTPAMVRVAALYKAHLFRECLNVLALVCAFRHPVATADIVVALGEELVPGMPNEGVVRAALRELDELELVRESGPGTFTVHPEVRRHFLPYLADASATHARIAAHFAERRDALTRAGTTGELRDRLLRNAEEAIHHQLEAGLFRAAHETCARWFDPWNGLQKGELTRGERVLADMLGHLPRAERTKSYPALLLALGRNLDQQARFDEAAWCYARALRQRLRRKQDAEACEVLRALAENAILRGRLPLAQKCAVRGVLLSEAIESGQLHLGGGGASPASLLHFVTALRHLHLPENLEGWKLHVAAGSESIWLCDVLIAIGQFADAREIAVANYRRTREEASSINLLAALQAASAVFWETAARVPAAPQASDAPPVVRPGARTLRRDVSQIALETSGCAPLATVLDWARDRGDVPLLCRALTFHATVKQLAGDLATAEEDVRLALRLARRHGLRLHVVSGLLTASRVAEDRMLRLSRELGVPASEADMRLALDPAREALQISQSAEVDSAWGRLQAEERLFELTARYGSEEQRREVERRAVAPFPTVRRLDEAPSRDVERVLAGTAPLRRWVAVEGDRPAETDAPVFCLPVESVFAVALAEIDAASDADDQASTLWNRLWTAYYTSHQLYPASIGPFYHLAVMLAMCGMHAHVGVAGEDLLARREALLGASLLAVARGASDPRSVMRRLEEALHHGGSDGGSGMPAATAAYNLAVLLQRTGARGRAVEAIEKSRHLDWSFSPARHAMPAADMAAELRQKCQRSLQQGARALEAWRTSADTYPASLDELAPHLISAPPSCPADMRGYVYLRARRGGRFLLFCPLHRLRLDSSLGLLRGAPSDGDFGSPAPCQAARKVKPGTLPVLHVTISSARAVRIVDSGGWPGRAKKDPG